MNEITIGDKIYISSKRAAEITGYAKDYVGQLCREGHVDAKMVGRSWYVYEPSIRAHRFGEAVEPELAQEVEKATVDLKENEETGPEQNPVSSWNEPKYSVEEPQTIPEVQAPPYEELLPPAEETLTDMQAAWREWFENKQKVLETPEIESPEVIEARYDEEYEEETDLEEVTIPLHHLEEESIEMETEEDDGEAVPVAIKPVLDEVTYEPSVSVPVQREISRVEAELNPQGTIVRERIVPKRRTKVRRSNAPVIALLVAISLCSIAVAVIGTGYADRYMKTYSAENPFIDYIVGTREYNKQ